MSKVILYHQNSCGPCKMIEAMLQHKNISYESCKDIEVMQSLGITQTPTLSVDGKLLIGSKEVLNWVNKQ